MESEPLDRKYISVENMCLPHVSTVFETQCRNSQSRQNPAFDWIIILHRRFDIGGTTMLQDFKHKKGIYTVGWILKSIYQAWLCTYFYLQYLLFRKGFTSLQWTIEKLVMIQALTKEILNVVFSIIRYERLKAAQIRREKALAELWSTSNRFIC
jgi:hypothetical protein